MNQPPNDYSVMAIMAAGLLVVLISGGIDISFAAIAAVSQYLMATVLVRFGGNWLLAFGLAAVFGALLGVVNALLIYYLQALAVIVTISTMTFYFAVLMFVTNGKSIYILSVINNCVFSGVLLSFECACNND
jgi:simple sugar transport system permease protein